MEEEHQIPAKGAKNCLTPNMIIISRSLSFNWICPLCRSPESQISDRRQRKTPIVIKECFKDKHDEGCECGNTNR
jgi:hypothetical protein